MTRTKWLLHTPKKETVKCFNWWYVVKTALIRFQLIYAHSASKWFNTSSNDLYILGFTHGWISSRVYVCRAIKLSNIYLQPTIVLGLQTFKAEPSKSLMPSNYNTLEASKLSSNITRQKEKLSMLQALELTTKAVGVSHLALIANRSMNFNRMLTAA